MLLLALSLVTMATSGHTYKGIWHEHTVYLEVIDVYTSNNRYKVLKSALTANYVKHPTFLPSEDTVVPSYVVVINNYIVIY